MVCIQIYGVLCDWDIFLFEWIPENINLEELNIQNRTLVWCQYFVTSQKLDASGWRHTSELSDVTFRLVTMDYSQACQQIFSILWYLTKSRHCVTSARLKTLHCDVISCFNLDIPGRLREETNWTSTEELNMFRYQITWRDLQTLKVLMWVHPGSLKHWCLAILVQNASTKSRAQHCQLSTLVWIDTQCWKNVLWIPTDTAHFTPSVTCGDL